MEHNLTIEEVDKQVEELEKKHAHKVSEADSKALEPGEILQKICGVVSIAVPILKFVKSLLFFKKKWQTIIQKVIDVVGMACGTEEV